MSWDEPRSTLSHCGSEAWLDQRVESLPSNAADAGVPAVLRRGRRSGPALRRVDGGAVAGLGSAGGAEHLELPDGVAPLRRPVDALQTYVPALAGDRERVGAAVSAGDRAQVGPGAAVGRGLDLVVLAVGRLPVDDDLADRGAGSEVDLQPLVVGGRRGPPGAGVAVDRVGRGRARVLVRGCRRRSALGQVGVGGHSHWWLDGGQGDQRCRGGERDTQGSESHEGPCGCVGKRTRGRGSSRGGTPRSLLRRLVHVLI